jgi:hypothetical protein
MAKRFRLPGASRRRDSLEDVRAMRRTHLVPVDQPLVMISQVNRSGGTLLSQLFAGHSACHVYPGELILNRPKDEWPKLDLRAGPARWLDTLYAAHLSEYAQEGYVKVPRKSRADYDPNEITFPFAFLPGLMEALFRERTSGASSQRDILDAYFTAFFNAWLDYQDLYTEKRWVVGFTPKLASLPDSVERFFGDYPDGRLISSIRDPHSWFVSLRGKRPDLPTADAITRWIRSTEAILEHRRAHGERVRVVSFQSLLEDTSGVMRKLSEWLGLEWEPILERPTFQRLDIRANSSWRVEKSGVLDAPLKRAAELSSQDRAVIDDAAGKLFDEARRSIDV